MRRAHLRARGSPANDSRKSSDSGVVTSFRVSSHLTETSTRIRFLIRKGIDRRYDRSIGLARSIPDFVSPLEPVRVLFKRVKVRFETLTNRKCSRRQFRVTDISAYCNSYFKRASVTDISLGMLQMLFKGVKVSFEILANWNRQLEPFETTICVTDIYAYCN